MVSVILISLIYYTFVYTFKNKIIFFKEMIKFNIFFSIQLKKKKKKFYLKVVRISIKGETLEKCSFSEGTKNINSFSMLKLKENKEGIFKISLQ